MFYWPHPTGDLDCKVSKLIEVTHNIVNFKKRGNSFVGFIIRKKFNHLYSTAKIIYDVTDNSSTYGTISLLKVATNENNDDAKFLQIHSNIVSEFRTVFRAFNKSIFKNI